MPLRGMDKLAVIPVTFPPSMSNAQGGGDSGTGAFISSFNMGEIDSLLSDLAAVALIMFSSCA